MMGCVGVQLGIGIKGNVTRKTDQHHRQLVFRMEIGVFAFWVCSSVGIFCSSVGC